VIRTPAIFFCVVFLGENLFPLRRRNCRRIPRYLVNAALTVLVFLVGIFILKPVVPGSSQLNNQDNFGLLALVPFSAPLKFFLAFMLMDLTFYWWHRANHILPILWRFHNVHHLDPDLDVTTSFRFHFVEILLSVAFRLAQVGLLGITSLIYTAYETVFACATIFHRSNLRLPITLERMLNRLIVTPRMHAIHHSNFRNETISNYSVVFRWWDKLHKTLLLNVPQAALTIGVPGYSHPADNRVARVIILPFTRQKDYWATPTGAREQRAEPSEEYGVETLAN